MQSFWKNNHELSALYAVLNEKIPAFGSCDKKSPKLEKLRKASNLYYEVMNNGGINTMHGFKATFGYSASYVRRAIRINSEVGNFTGYNRLVADMDKTIAGLVIESAQEQLQK